MFVYGIFALDTSSTFVHGSSAKPVHKHYSMTCLNELE